MATAVTTRSGWEPVTPWWERAQAPWKGEMFARAILKPGDRREQRIQLIRQELLQKVDGKRGQISTHRARLVTESYRQTEGQSAVTRRAKAFYHILAHIPIPFPRYQLLAGSPMSIPLGVECFPEFSSWMEQKIEVAGQRMTELEAMPVRPVMPLALAEEDRRCLQEEIFPYWRGKTNFDFITGYLKQHCPEALRHMDEAQVIRAGGGGGLAHTVQDYRSVIEKGLRGLIAEMRAERDQIDLAYPTEGVRSFERREMYEGMILVAEGLIRYAERCAEEAERLANEESDPERAAELREMARICRKVPAGPAETFREAVQVLHLCHMATNLTENAGSHSGGRIDQFLYPYLKADLAAGRSSKEEAQEILECLFLKFFEYQMPLALRGAEGMVGFRANDKITIGGTDEYARDVTNELSYMCLEAQAHTHLNEPNLSLRMHKNTPDDFLKRALEVIRLGGGLPQLINDEVIVPGLVAFGGTTLEDARHYADIGCQENVTDPNSSPTRADTNGHTNTGWFNLAKPIELAIWNGVNPLNGKQGGPASGDVRQMKTMDEFVAAVRAQFEEAVRLNVITNNAIEYGFTKCMPCMYHNLMHSGPRKTGIDLNAGGCKYNWTGNLSVALATAADSLSAVATLVYSEGGVSWDELQAALKANWVGYEELRARCIATPKYGTDNDFADGWARVVTEMLFAAYEQYPTTKGGHFLTGLVSMSTYETLGRQTGPTPDGRRSQEMLSDSVAPSIYAPPMGPTATHRSVARAIDAIHTVNGVTFNQKFNESSLMSERELSKWADLVRTYMEEGGQCVQYTVVNRRVLQEAQQHPERFNDLVVRVGGYSALFVELSKELQDSIIARAELEL